jgi:hypothetical protein
MARTSTRRTTMTTRLAAGLVALLILLLATVATAGHHPLDVCPNGHVGNCEGPNDPQNETFYLGAFEPGDTFDVGIYLKKLEGPQVCEVAWWLAHESGVLNSVGSPTINPTLSSLVAALTGPGADVQFYQYGQGLAGGTPECPTCTLERKYRLFDATFHEGHTPQMPMDIADPNNPLGWLTFEVSTFAQPGTYNLTMSRGWIQTVNANGTCFECTYSPDGCTGLNFEWISPPEEVNQFTFDVVEPFVPTCWDADVDGDGVVAGSDLSIMLGHYGEACE